MQESRAAPRALYPLVLVDVALFSIVDDALKVMLVQRAQAPEQGRWALPGGILKPDIDPDLEHAARRVLRDKVSLDLPHLEEVRSFSGAARDPRGWSLALLFYALLPRDQLQAVIRSKVEAIDWVCAGAPQPPMAFDHGLQLAAALARLRDKVERHALPLHLLPQKFTLSELQRTCECILGRPLDKSVFRRRLKGSDELVELDEYQRGQQRPAQLFSAGPAFRF